jgi:hypothetical protein
MGVRIILNYMIKRVNWEGLDWNDVAQDRDRLKLSAREELHSREVSY